MEAVSNNCHMLSILKRKEEKTAEKKKFAVKLNGDYDLKAKLDEFAQTCIENDRTKYRKGKKRFYHLGLVAQADGNTTKEDLLRLLKAGARTFVLDAVTIKPKEFQQILLCINTAIQQYQLEHRIPKLVTALGVEIRGDCCRLGRMRNNASLLVKECDIITMTTKTAYRYCGFREIVYVINLKHYIRKLKIGDEIMLGSEIRLKVVKTLKDNIAVEVLCGGMMCSYDWMELPKQCCMLLPQNYPELYKHDLKLAVKAQANFVVASHVCCKHFLNSLVDAIQKYDIRLIGILDVEFIARRMLDIMGLITLIDFVWIKKFFSLSKSLVTYIYDEVVPIARCLKKPIIGYMPLQRCKDLKVLKNHEFLWKLDSISIEKSPWCHKFPLVVKKLLPIKDFRLGIVDNDAELKSVMASSQSIVNFMIRTMCTNECQAVFLYSICEQAAVCLSKPEVYCRVFVMLPLAIDEPEEVIKRKTELTRMYQLRRNLKPIMYTPDMNPCDLEPIDYGIEFARKRKFINTGDLVMTLEIMEENGEEEVQLEADNTALLRAFYVTPIKDWERYKYA